jgi:hypothetical protein
MLTYDQDQSCLGPPECILLVGNGGPKDVKERLHQPLLQHLQKKDDISGKTKNSG